MINLATAPTKVVAARVRTIQSRVKSSPIPLASNWYFVVDASSANNLVTFDHQLHYLFSRFHSIAEHLCKILENIVDSSSSSRAYGEVAV